MTALLLPKYSRMAASSRLRIYQYIPYLQSQGWVVQLQALFGDAYLTERLGKARTPIITALICMLRRLLYLLTVRLGRFDVVVVHVDLFAHSPFFIERLFLRQCRRLIVDFDDALFVYYRSNPLAANKYSQLLKRANGVIAGNRVLQSFAVEFNDDVTIIPTVIDLTAYRPRDDYALKEATFIIGWIGSPSTSKHLLEFADVFRSLAKEHCIRLRCVGAEPSFTISGLDVERLPWSEITEADVIRTFDAGVMPLISDEFSKGKCGFKLIQYMGCGVPCIGTALGANTDIISDNVNGFLAQTKDEFRFKLASLIQNQELRERLGKEGRAAVERTYSLHIQQIAFETVLRRIAQLPNVSPHLQRDAATLSEGTCGS